jgi:hypothetical protein
MEKLHGPVKSVLENGGDASDIKTSSLSVNLNKVEHAGTSIYVKAQLLSPE